jgi:hypothetical protein
VVTLSADLHGDVLHAALGLPPALRVQQAKVGKLTIKVMLCYFSFLPCWFGTAYSGWRYHFLSVFPVRMVEKLLTLLVTKSD